MLNRLGRPYVRRMKACTASGPGKTSPLRTVTRHKLKLLDRLDRISCELDPLLATQQLQQDKYALVRT